LKIATYGRKKKMYEWMHDDITWCGNECSNTKCERNITNKILKEGIFTMSLFRETTTCPLYMKEHTWIKVPGYCTPGGDPVWACPKCHGTQHVYGVEHPDRREICEECGQRNYYPYENG
jgi:hypothetical protein